MADRFLVFVYGTLKKGFPNHDRHMASARLLGTYRTRNRYRLILNGERLSPCMIAGKNAGYRVIGEVYEVDRTGLSRMDRLERINCADGYRRYRIMVDRFGGPHSDALEAFVYLKDPHIIDDPRSAALKEYTSDLAQRYRKRSVDQFNGEEDHG